MTWGFVYLIIGVLAQSAILTATSDTEADRAEFTWSHRFVGKLIMVACWPVVLFAASVAAANKISEMLKNARRPQV